MDWIIANYQSILAIVGGIFTLATAIAAITPSETDNKVIDTVAKFANKFGYTFKPGAVVKG